MLRAMLAAARGQAPKGRRTRAEPEQPRFMALNRLCSALTVLEKSAATGIGAANSAQPCSTQARSGTLPRMSQLVASFLEFTAKSDSKVEKRFSKFSEDGDLHALLQRFDYDQSGALDPEQVGLALQALRKMHTPSAKGFAAMRAVFDYLNVNDDQTLEHEELTLALEVLDLFCKADSVNDTLSAKELGMLGDALKKLDTDNNGVLDAQERIALRDGLWDPDAFLAELLEKK